MKVVLAGYEGSKEILTASSYLIDKYLPKDFDVYFLNYGTFFGKLYTGTYVPLDYEQRGGSQSWSKYILTYLRTFKDKYIIFGLDDYLLNGPLITRRYNDILRHMGDNVVCGRLCDSSFYKKKRIEGRIMYIEPDDYTCTTQYCIWDREALCSILELVNTPWEFELTGTNIFNSKGYVVIGTIDKALDYPDYSCLSSKWKGVETKDNNPEDINYLKKMLHL